MNGLQLFFGENDFVKCHIDLQIPDYIPLDIETTQCGFIEFEQLSRAFTEYFDAEIFENCIKQTVRNESLEMVETGIMKEANYMASTIYDRLTVAEKCNNIACFESFWNRYPAFWKWDREIKIISLDKKGTVLNIIYHQNKIRECYFKDQTQVYHENLASNIIPSGMFRGYEMMTGDARKHYKHIFIHGTNNMIHDIFVQVYDCINETDFECDTLDYVRFMKHNSDSKQILSDRYHIDFGVAVTES